jgi:alpha-L-rhamnosidase
LERTGPLRGGIGPNGWLARLLDRPELHPGGRHAGFYGFDPRRPGAHYGEAPELLAELVLRLADGSEQRVVTDGQWHSSAGAIRSRERDSTPLVADLGPPIRVAEEIVPRSIATDDHGRHIVDFGQNLTGWLRIRVDGPSGARIRIRHGEVLAADGSLYTDNLRTARATDEFTTAGGSEVLEPRFTLHGFRYAEITGYPGDIGQAAVTARVVHSDTPATGSFECSLPWLDQLFRAIDRGQRGNFISVPTDCPQRDERLGWLGDAQVFIRTACYNRDVAAFFAKWLDDVADAQLPSGAFTDVAPRLTLTGSGAPAWGDAGVIIPWTVWKMYGDTAVLGRHFGAMTRWMDFPERANPDYLRTRELGNSYNDRLTPASSATSSRRRPATRRAPASGETFSPACSGVIRARREVRKSRISARRSIP